MIGSPRGRLNETGRTIVKISLSSLTREDGGLDLNRIDSVARLVACWRIPDEEILIVSSGTVVAGLDPFGFSLCPRDLTSVQAIAATGQGLFVTHRRAAFQTHHLSVTQLPLTTENVMLRQHYMSVRASLDRLFGLDVVPIINENDAVAIREVRFGDNDRLASYMVQMVVAGVLVLLTDIDGSCTTPPNHPGPELTREMTSIDQLHSVLVTGAISEIGSGDMVTRVQVAIMVASSGIGVVLVSADHLGEVLSSEDVGMWFEPSPVRLASRHLWIAHAALIQGEVIIDEGASRVITHRKRPLLVTEVTCVIGHFDSGEVVDITGPIGLLGCGIVSYDPDAVAQVTGQSAANLRLTGWVYPKFVVHCDNLAPLL